MSIQELYSPGKGPRREEKAKIDIIAIHGLNPRGREDHARHTWETSSVRLWLRDPDALPSQVPYARTLLYEYNSSPAFGADKERFVHQANSLLECILIARREHPERPLILIGHSLGGILIKQALVNACANSRYKSIQENTFALVFFGTPHAGPTEDTKVKFGKAWVAIVQSIPGHLSNDIMQALKKGSLFADVLQDNWRHQLEKYRIVSFYEGIGNLVPRESAVMGLPGHREDQVKLDASHRDMCRFDPDAPQDKKNYFLVEGNMLELCIGAIVQVPVEKPEYIEIKNSLKHNSRNPRFDEVVASHHKSLQWLWSTDQSGPGFINWLASGSGIFWINGKPGSGKSTLMKYAYCDPRLKECLNQESESAFLAKFFFYDQGLPMEKSFSGLLYSMIYQLLEALPELANVVWAAYQKAKQRSEARNENDNETVTWAQGELEEALLHISRQCEIPGHVCFFIDGLDECEGSYRHEVDFLVRFATPYPGSVMRIQLCISSRPETAIKLRFEDFLGFKIHDMTANDISKYVSDKLEQSLNYISGAEENMQAKRLELIQKVVEKSSGVFLWVKLVVDDLMEGLEDGDNDEELWKRLDDLPPDLENLYKRIVEKIPTGYTQDFVYYFHIVLEAPAHLKLAWFCLAVDGPEEAISRRMAGLTSNQLQEKCQKMERRLQSRTRGLIQAENDSVGLLHRSVKDWFTREGVVDDILTRAQLSPPEDPNVALMSMFLHLMKVQPNQMLAARGSYLDFGSIRSCLHHARAAEKSTLFPQIKVLDSMDGYCSVFDPLWHEKYITSSGKGESPMDLGSWKSTFLSVAISETLLLYVQVKMSHRHFKISKPGRPYLRDAVGHIWNIPGSELSFEMLEVLLQHNALPNELFEDRTAWELIMWAFKSVKWLDLLHLFLDHGADPNRRLAFEGFNNATPLHVVINSYRLSDRVWTDEELAAIIMKFMDCGADPNISETTTRTAP